ncbi:three-Cys-motif partner protein TcmP [Luteimonas sp. XNQY3]|nr:three-Cys-motif partner protein TcmP [Luteimonas sp. XNQY3]MCD9008007.1 three-Cys-motif partner protein TcmP [Luteimonas sp. XNQY3]
MTLSHYSWEEGSLPVIQQHSIAKHDVLREYLVEYLKTLAHNPARETLSLTLVDGFAGGGVYRHEDTRETVLGSPFVFLKAVEEAQFVIDQGRRKPLQWNLAYYFVEKKRRAQQHLRCALEARGYGARFDQDIHLVGGSFEQHADELVMRVLEKTPRSGRSIFLLDQYGYSDVPASRIRSIFHRLESAEVILTFAVDAFINYASDSPKTRKLLEKMDLPNLLKGRSIDSIKSKEKDFRLFIQSAFYEALVEQCGATFFTVFFIRTTGHGDYWLVHLSQHPRARDVMTTVHWNKNNHFIHYGGAGLNMFKTLGYDPAADSAITGQNELGFCFDSDAAAASVRALSLQLSPIIHATPDGVTFEELFTSTCNLTPANSERYREALAHLIAVKEVTATSPKGARRLSANTIEAHDNISVARQSNFIFER